MKPVDYEPTLATAVQRAEAWLRDYEQRPVGPPVDVETLLGADPVGALPDAGIDPAEAVDELAAWLEPGLSALGSGRYLALVNGGLLPAGLGADWLVSAWDQNAPFAEHAPSSVAAEHVAGRWILDLLDLPRTAAVGFPTGAQGANTIALLAARHHVLAAHGHDVESAGLVGAPPVTVIAGAEAHSTIHRSLRVIGLGTGAVVPVATDDRGRMCADAAAAAIESADGPVIVCAQAGNVNGGGFDPLGAVADAVAARRDRRDDIWLHVDGAFGLWVRAGSVHRDLADGAERADSWTTDAHKWLNTPYDCGIVIVADRDALARSVGLRASYLPTGGDVADPAGTVLEASRRARGVPVWAVLRSLGRHGVAALVDDACAVAARLAAAVDAIDGLLVRGQEINQVVVEAVDPAGAPDPARTDAVLAAVIADGRCYPSTTSWQGRPGIRLSVSSWRAAADDVEVIAAAFADAVAATSG